MKKSVIYLIVGLLVVCGLGGLALRSMKGAAAGPEASTAKVARGDLDVEAVETGTLNAANVVELKSLVSGRLERLLVDEGQIVKAGQLVAVIDPRETQLQVDQSRAQVVGAQSLAKRSEIELDQRKLSAQSDLASAKARLLQAEQENEAQPELTRTAIEEAKTGLASAQKERQRLAQSAEPNEQVAAQGAVDEAKSNLQNAAAELKRDQALLAKGYVSQKQVEDDLLQSELSKTRLQSAKDSLATLRAGFPAELAKADQAIAQAQAGVDSAEANSIQNKIKRQAYLSAVADRDKAIVALRDVDAMRMGVDQNKATVAQLQSALSDGERNLGETEIRSPIDGIVTKKEIREGELVASISGFSSGTPIVRIEDRHGMKVQLDINEIDVASMTLGMPVAIAVDAFPNESFEGKISKIAPSSTAMDTADASTSSTASTTADTVVKYAVEVTVSDPNSKLRSGMSAKCTFKLDHRPNVLYLPLEFVGHDAKGDFVMLAGKGKDKAGKPNPATRVAVKVGAKNATDVELKSGVTEGEDVVRPDYAGPKRQGAMGMGG